MCLLHLAGLAESVARTAKGEGLSAGSLAAAGHRVVGVQASDRAAVLRLCLNKTGSGGIAASAATIVTGVYYTSGNSLHNYA